VSAAAAGRTGENESSKNPNVDRKLDDGPIRVFMGSRSEVPSSLAYESEAVYDSLKYRVVVPTLLFRNDRCKIKQLSVSEGAG